jgi:hypothetical protein
LIRRFGSKLATIPAAEKLAMNKQNHMDAKKRLKLGTCYFPMCDNPPKKAITLNVHALRN